MTITILTESGAYCFGAADDWGRDHEGDVHVYEGDETLASFDGDAFEAVLQGVSGERQEAIAQEHALSTDDTNDDNA